MEKVPKEILKQILGGVPKLRLRLVCKLWNQLLAELGVGIGFGKLYNNSDKLPDKLNLSKLAENWQMGVYTKNAVEITHPKDFQVVSIEYVAALGVVIFSRRKLSWVRKLEVFQISTI